MGTSEARGQNPPRYVSFLSLHLTVLGGRFVRTIGFTFPTAHFLLFSSARFSLLTAHFHVVSFVPDFSCGFLTIA